MKTIEPRVHVLNGADFPSMLAEIAVILRDTLADRFLIVQAAIHIENRYRGLHEHEQLTVLFKGHNLSQPTIKEFTPNKLILWIRPVKPWSLLDGVASFLKWARRIFLNSEPTASTTFDEDIAKEACRKLTELVPNAIPIRLVLTVFKADSMEKIQTYFGETNSVRMERLLALLPRTEARKLRSIDEFEIVSSEQDTTLRAFDVQIHCQMTSSVPILRLRWHRDGQSGGFTPRKLTAVPVQGLTIGRNTGCDYNLEFPKVSGQHLKVKPFKTRDTVSGIILTDENSSNGTYEHKGNVELQTTFLVKVGESVTLVLGCGRVGQRDENGQILTAQDIKECIENPDSQQCITLEVSLV